MTSRLSLREALRTNRLDKFIAQAEADGIGPADKRVLADVIKNVVKPRQSEDRTSRSPSRDGLTGK